MVMGDYESNVQHRCSDQAKAIPQEGSVIFDLRRDFIALSVASFLDVERRQDADYRQPHRIQGEVSSWTESPSKPEEASRILSIWVQLAIVGQEPVWLELHRIRVRLRVVQNGPKSVSEGPLDLNAARLTTRYRSRLTLPGGDIRDRCRPPLAGVGQRACQLVATLGSPSRWRTYREAPLGLRTPVGGRCRPPGQSRTAPSSALQGIAS